MSLPMGPFPERALRPMLTDTSPLDRIEAARAAVAAAPREHVAVALDQLDRVFEEITGRPAARSDDDSGGGRTVAYLDCMRDLEVTIGAPVLDELRASLPAVLYASRWWCGRVFDRGAELLNGIAHDREGPLAPLLGELMGAGFGLWNQMGDEQRELRRRWAALVSGAVPAAEAFADWTAAWHGSNYHSADLQIAAGQRGRHRSRRLSARPRRLPRWRQSAGPRPVRPPSSRSRRADGADRHEPAAASICLPHAAAWSR